MTTTAEIRSLQADATIMRDRLIEIRQILNRVLTWDEIDTVARERLTDAANLTHPPA
tara:strand:+ start:6437 stop:6607 length:171 start_codon:yes stop_codon:yes gene_type:complete